MRWGRSKKDSTILSLTARAVKLVKIQDNLLLSQNNESQSLTLASLVKLDDDLFNDDNIWFQSSKNMKIYSIIQQQQNDVEEIIISTIYEEMMTSSEKNHWIIIMNSEIKKHCQWKLFTWVSRSKEVRILWEKWIYLMKVDKNENIIRYKI